MFRSLIKGQRGIVCAYNPFKKLSWDYVVKELKPILDGEHGDPNQKWIVIGSHMIKGHSSLEPDVKEQDVIDFCNKNNIFHVRIDGGSN